MSFPARVLQKFAHAMLASNATWLNEPTISLTTGQVQHTFWEYLFLCDLEYAFVIPPQLAGPAALYVDFFCHHHQIILFCIQQRGRSAQ
jgi:hypothetical protein